MKEISRTAEMFFEADVWDLRKCPVGAGAYFQKSVKDKTLDFSGIANEQIKIQVKDYLRHEIVDGFGRYKTPHELSSFTFKYKCWAAGIKFLQENSSSFTDVIEDSKELNSKYLEYLKENQPVLLMVGRKGTLSIKNNLLLHTKEYWIARGDEGLSVWERNIWYRDQLPLKKEQIDLSNNVISLRFEFARNPEDRKCIKLFLRYVLENRETCFSTLSSYHASIKEFVQWLQEHDQTFLRATRDDVKAYWEYMEKKVSHSTFDSRVSHLFRAYEYLQLRGLVTFNPVLYTDRHRDPYHYRLASVDDQTIIQIFSALHLIKPRLVTIFLLVYSTGMRISEACLIRNDCLLSNEKGCFVMYYCQKMKKDVMSPICPALYKRIEKEVQANADLEWDEEYLFWRAPHKPYLAATFRDQFNEELKKLGVCDSNGQPYIFKPHDLRHTIATKLYKSGSTIAVIQKLLHHVSIEMSLAYVESSMDYMKTQHTKYLNYRGEDVPIEHDTERLQWLRNNIHAQALPNGICGLPVEMGECPHRNACLDGCPYFKTSGEYLEIHRSHLAGMEEYINQCTHNGWKGQLEGAQRIRDNLKAIIRRLQNE